MPAGFERNASSLSDQITAVAADVDKKLKVDKSLMVGHYGRGVHDGSAGWHRRIPVSQAPLTSTRNMIRKSPDQILRDRARTTARGCLVF